MLKKTEFRIENLSKPLADIDVTSSGYWIGVTDYSNAEQSFLFGGSQIKLPEKIRFPIVRNIDEQTALIVDSRIQVLNYEFEEYEPGKNRLINTTYLNENNAWVITSEGKIKTNFSAGDAIQDVVITKDFIVVTYFDERYGSGGIESGRVTIFDFNGKFLFGYIDTFGDAAVDVFDCYAASLVKENELIFFPYTGFPLVLLNIENKTQQIWYPPEELAGSDAITKLNDKIYFHSPYSDQTGIYEWQIGSKTAKKIGEYSSYLRGMPNGRFIAVGDSDYTIISLQ